MSDFSAWSAQLYHAARGECTPGSALDSFRSQLVNVYDIFQFGRSDMEPEFLDKRKEFQEFLFDLGPDVYCACLDMAKQMDIAAVMTDLLLAVRYRWNQHEIFGDLVRDIIDGNDDVMDDVCRCVVAPLCERKTLMPEQHRPFFAFRLVNRDIVRIDYIAKWLHYLRQSFHSSTKELRSFFFLWLAPELEASCPELFREMSHENEKFWKYRFFSTVMYDVCTKFEEYRKDNWKLLRESRENTYLLSPLVRVIWEDDIDSLLNASTAPDFCIDSGVRWSTFQWRLLFLDCRTWIQIAALCGAVKCFKYLLMNGASLETIGFHGSSICNIAVAGGNSEILRLLEEKGLAFDDAIHTAAQCHRNSIFNWFLDTGKYSLVDTTGACPVINAAIKSNNFHVFLLCLEQHIDIMKSGFQDVPFTLTTPPPFTLPLATTAMKCSKSSSRIAISTSTTSQTSKLAHPYTSPLSTTHWNACSFF